MSTAAEKRATFRALHESGFFLLPNAWDVAPTFVSAGLDTAWLTKLTDQLPAASHADALCWIEARLNLKSLIAQIEQSTGRIGELVKAVKSYSYMDQSPMQEVDIHEGIESTLVMLGHKLKGVTLRRAYDRSLPRVMAYGGELNQVWTNLIDNAIDAVTEGDFGKMVALRATDIVRVPLVEATRELKTVPVERYTEAEVFFG